MSGGWDGSTRKDGLPTWWPVTVRRIIKRDPTCLCEGCKRCAVSFGNPGAGCLRPSAEVDHIKPGNDHHDANLRGLCRPCHARKSSSEGNAAKAAKKAPSGFHAEIKAPGDLW